MMTLTLEEEAQETSGFPLSPQEVGIKTTLTISGPTSIFIPEVVGCFLQVRGTYVRKSDKATS